ncbi:hypothetical protein [Azospirillum sp. ST 5-10]|uniref:hypothetical protein n=1 Tax=unclassified Azospirillum TaxID=2630922 RepID=UPI003F4A0B12
MRWLDRMFTRRDHHTCFDPVPERTAPRIAAVCAQLGDTERQVQEHLGLRVRPRLTLVDEESARIIGPRQREAVERRGRRS